jgi:hypothetical protein
MAKDPAGVDDDMRPLLRTTRNFIIHSACRHIYEHIYQHSANFGNKQKMSKRFCSEKNVPFYTLRVETPFLVIVNS